MAILPVYAGEAVHHLRDGSVRRFRPTGPLLVREAYKDNPIEPLGQPLAARMFIGLNVGEKQGFTPEYVIDLIYKIRKAQDADPSMSVLSQLGVYQDSSGRRIDEQSLQVILIDTSGSKTFIEDVKTLAEELRTRLEQERIIVEIQRGGVVESVFSATDPRVLAQASER